jgi:hypothetical protein
MEFGIEVLHDWVRMWGEEAIIRLYSGIFLEELGKILLDHIRNSHYLVEIPTLSHQNWRQTREHYINPLYECETPGRSVALYFMHVYMRGTARSIFS